MKLTLLIAAIGLLAPCVGAATQPKVVRPDTVVPIPFPGHATATLAAPTDTQSRTAVLELEVPPRTFGAPPHVHSHEDEYFYVLDGRVEFLDRDTVVTAQAGSLLVLPRGNVHGFWNLTDAPARLLLVVAPGDFAGFFDDVVARIRADHIQDPEAVAALIGLAAAQRGVQVLPERTPESARALLTPQ
ncbi:MAG: cupin domain-containing protein [Gammaproteobacteria bacterium]|nr:cupin domain-containing protein [Gammaproteobacteria bacterium]